MSALTRSIAVMMLTAAVPFPAYSQEAISLETVVTAPSEKAAESLRHKRLKSSDTAALLNGVAGVALATGGGV